MERRLAAILAADVVGYSRLMEADEEATARTLGIYREIIEGLVASHHGRVFGSAGDSVIAEFASPVEAVRCAVAIQRKLESQNVDLPEDRRMRLRIGVNLGDVMVDGDNLLGDGVNVAARLEGLAEPGGICLSGMVHQSIEGKLDLAFDDLGEQEVKNIAKPVRAYKVLVEPGAAAVTVPGHQTRRSPVPDKPSIAVLPFVNMSADPEQEYFSDGITEDIITGLSKNRLFFVISRGTSFKFKGTSVDISQIAQELAVRYVLEGSVRKAGNLVRITAQLSDAPVSHQVWAERYDRKLEDIFSVQDEITQNIIGSLAPGIMSAEIQRAQRKETGRLEAWDFVMRAHWHIRRFTKDDTIKARGLLHEALELEPNNAAALSDLAFAGHFEAIFGWTDDPADSLALVGESARKAVAADNHNALAHTALAIFELFSNRHDDAVRRLHTACDLDPNLVFARGYLGVTYAFGGDHDAAMPHFVQAIRMSPHDPLLVIWHIAMGWAFLAAEQYQEAVEFSKQAIDDNPEFTDNYSVLAACLGHLGHVDAARAALEQLLRRLPGLTTHDERLTRPFKRAVDKERFVEGLIKAGLPE